jgi:hypothetical protein
MVQKTKWKRRKFKPGGKVDFFETVLAGLERKQWFYIHDKPVHPAVIGSMQLSTVLQLVESGSFRIAEPCL